MPRTELKMFTESLSFAKPAAHTAVAGTTGAIGLFVAYAFGGWSESLSFLFIAMAIDYVTGVLASVKEGKGLNSAIGFWGLLKKGLMLTVILLAHRADILLDTPNVATTGAVFFYIANELISIVENFGRIGLPLPAQLKNIITVLQNKGK